jgi:hypothetical protein
VYWITRTVTFVTGRRWINKRVHGIQMFKN